MCQPRGLFTESGRLCTVLLERDPKWGKTVESIYSAQNLHLSALIPRVKIQNLTIPNFFTKRHTQRQTLYESPADIKSKGGPITMCLVHQ